MAEDVVRYRWSARTEDVAVGDVVEVVVPFTGEKVEGRVVYVGGKYVRVRVDADRVVACRVERVRSVRRMI